MEECERLVRRGADVTRYHSTAVTYKPIISPGYNSSTGQFYSFCRFSNSTITYDTCSYGYAESDAFKFKRDNWISGRELSKFSTLESSSW